jgi:hypothetical protein
MLDHPGCRQAYLMEQGPGKLVSDFVEQQEVGVASAGGKGLRGLSGAARGSAQLNLRVAV